MPKWKEPPPPSREGKRPNQQQWQNLHPEAEAEEAKERRSRRLSKILKQIGRTVRLDVRIRRLSKIPKAS